MKSQRARREISRPRRKARGEGYQRRGEILAAARNLFLKEGVERVTIRAICAAVGVTPPALYRHFRDKRELMIAICNQTFGRLLEAFKSIRARDDEPIRILTQMMQTYVRFALEHPDEYRLSLLVKEFLDEKALGDIEDDEAAIALGMLGPLVCRELAIHVSTCIEKGLLKPGDPVLITETLWALGHGLASLLIVHPNFIDSETDALLSSSIAMALDGIRCRA